MLPERCAAKLMSYIKVINKFCLANYHETK